MKDLISLDEKVKRDQKEREAVRARESSELRLASGMPAATLGDEEPKLTIGALLARAEAKSAVLEEILHLGPQLERF